MEEEDRVIISHPVKVSLDECEDASFYLLYQRVKTIYIEELHRSVSIYYNKRLDYYCHMINTSQFEERTKLNSLLEISGNTIKFIKEEMEQ